MDYRKRGSTSNIVKLFIPDNSVTTGAGVTGLTYASTNLRVSYLREKDAALTSYTGANIEDVTTLGTYQAPSSSSKCRFKETVIPGVYEIHFHNSATAFGTGDTSQKVVVLVAEDTTTDLKIGPNAKEIQLGLLDLQQTIPIQVLDEVNTGATHNVKNSVGQQLRTGGSAPDIVLASGTCQTGSTANTIKLATTASATNNIYYPNLVAILSGPGAGQTRTIVAYNGTTKVATVDRAWVTTPTNASTYSILASARSVASYEGLATAGGNSTVNLGTDASAQNDFYNGAIVVIQSGTGSGQFADVTDYTGSSKQISIAPATWSANPDTTSVIAVIPTGTTVVDSNNPVTLAQGQLAIRRNAAFSAFPFVMFDAVSKTLKTGLTVTAERSIDGAAFAACANSPAEVGGGMYNIDLAAADLAGTVIMLKFSATGADTSFIAVVTQV